MASVAESPRRAASPANPLPFPGLAAGASPRGRWCPAWWARRCRSRRAARRRPGGGPARCTCASCSPPGCRTARTGSSPSAAAPSRPCAPASLLASILVDSSLDLSVFLFACGSDAQHYPTRRFISPRRVRRSLDTNQFLKIDGLLNVTVFVLIF
jgi:hypothetical protein